MALTIQDLQLLRELIDLLSTAASERDLKNWVEQATGDDFGIYMPSGLNKTETLRAMLTRLLTEDQQDRAGILELFLLEVYRDRPMRPRLRSAIARIRPRIAALAGLDNARIQIIDANRDARPLSANVGGDIQETLRQQRITDPNNPMLHGVAWARQLYENLTRVCMVEVKGQPAGTGFLVGPAAVLTNWHVVEGVDAKEITCRFDYAMGDTGRIDSGKQLLLDEGGILCSSPYWPNERSGLITPQGAPADCLDFALLEIKADALHAGGARGHIPLTDNPPMPSVDSPLIILQHPAGAPVQVAIDTRAVVGWQVLDQNDTPFWSGPPDTRFRYRTNTMGGSSGSPCFTMDWTLIALHHMGHSGSLLSALNLPGIAFNQGVPVGLIRKSIVAAGCESHLGGVS